MQRQAVGLKTVAGGQPVGDAQRPPGGHAQWRRHDAYLGTTARGPLRFTDWLPTSVGFEANRLALHEWIGRLAGA